MSAGIFASWLAATKQLDAPPRLGDSIVDAEEQSWTIIEIQPPAITGRWLCLARNLAIASGLEQLVDIHDAFSEDHYVQPFDVALEFLKLLRQSIIRRCLGWLVIDSTHESGKRIEIKRDLLPRGCSGLLQRGRMFFRL